jgi:hypothetical protein
MTDFVAGLQIIEEHKVSLALIASVIGNVFLAMKWLVERRDKKEVNHRIRPTFVSLFGRYVLENMNIYRRDQHNQLVGHTINDIPERDTYFKVEAVIPWFLYRVVPARSDDRMIVFLRRTPSDHRRTVAFNIVS